MRSFAVFATFALLATQACVALMVNTPVNVVQCLPVRIEWNGGTSPYYLSLIPAAQPAAPAMKTWPQTNDNQLTWKADLGTGASFNIAVRDGTGMVAYSDIVTVTTSSDSSCVNAAVTESLAGATGTSTANTTATASTSASGSGSHSSAASAGSASLAKATSGALKTLSMNAAGVTGLLVVIGAALL